ncbi:hypothetical protein AB0F18_21340 [Streptomyces sp. NPDC029216]|uniref:hypothetical protein n=1 Tax=Streptomyces sp. NPDC029216 TaxID=3154701 RepID=UPI0033FAFC7C
MKDEGTVPVTARVAYGTRGELNELLKRERKRRAAIAADSQWSTQRLSRRFAAEVRAAWRKRLSVIRNEGELLDTLDALVAFGVRQELKERGWDHPWPLYPPKARNTGRWPGAKQGGYPEKLTFRLPACLENQVRAACWHTSAPAIRELYDWHERHRLILSKRRCSPTGLDDALEIYGHLAAKVTTTGTIWRSGVRRGIEATAKLCASTPKPV